MKLYRGGVIEKLYFFYNKNFSFNYNDFKQRLKQNRNEFRDISELERLLEDIDFNGEDSRDNILDFALITHKKYQHVLGEILEYVDDPLVSFSFKLEKASGFSVTLKDELQIFQMYTDDTHYYLFDGNRLSYNHNSLKINENGVEVLSKYIEILKKILGVPVLKFYYDYDYDYDFGRFRELSDDYMLESDHSVILEIDVDDKHITTNLSELLSDKPFFNWEEIEDIRGEWKEKEVTYLGSIKDLKNYVNSARILFL